VDNNEIDASLGLMFSLELFATYKQSGLLQAEMRFIPRLLGRGIACLQLVDGIVVSAYVEDSDKRRYPVSKEMLIQIDNEKGPFAWRLSAEVAPASAPVTPSDSQNNQSVPQRPSVPLPSLPDTAVPAIVRPFEWEQWRNWNPQQQQILYTVWRTIDGKKTIRDIKAQTSSFFPAATVEEALQIFLKLKLVVITL
jgi:hypothetical protein